MWWRKSLSPWHQLSQVPLSGSRYEVMGCHGSSRAWTLSGCDAMHEHTVHTLSHKQTVGNIIDCRIINRKQQKAAPHSSSLAPMGPHHSHPPLHSSLLNTYIYLSSLQWHSSNASVPLVKFPLLSFSQVSSSGFYAICLSPKIESLELLRLME